MGTLWTDPSSAWWAKAARALTHLREIKVGVAQFERSRPYVVNTEIRNDSPNSLAFVFNVLKPVTIELLTAVGDALHNMRSSLDSVAYELARQHLGREMTPTEEEKTQFPICRDAAKFESWFEDHGYRKYMYGRRERDILRCVQPFALRDEAIELGVDVRTPAEVEYLTDELSRLHTLSNVDKHRHLPFLVWYPELPYWGKPDGNLEYRWRRPSPPPNVFEDGTLIGYLDNTRSDGRPVADVTVEFHLTLKDDPTFQDPEFRNDVVSVLERWHTYLVRWVLPRMFAVAAGNRPPIIIGH